MYLRAGPGLFHAYQLLHLLPDGLLVIGGAGQDQGLELGAGAFRARVQITLSLGQRFGAPEFNIVDLKNNRANL